MGEVSRRKFFGLLAGAPVAAAFVPLSDFSQAAVPIADVPPMVFAQKRIYFSGLPSHSHILFNNVDAGGFRFFGYDQLNVGEIPDGEKSS